MNIKSDKGDLYCLWCDKRQGIPVIQNNLDGTKRFIFIPIIKNFTLLNYICDENRNVIGLECPTCHRKVKFIEMKE